MTVVFETPPGVVASDFVARFTMDREPTNISVRYFPVDADDNPIPGSWDVVYGQTDEFNENGVFSDKFADSERDGSNWTIRPPGGTWPCRIRVIVDESPNGFGGEGVAGTLHPVFSPDFWYVLDPISRLVDQSGNGNTLTQITAAVDVAGPDIGYIAAKAGRYRHSGNATLRTNGAVSVIALVNRASESSTFWFAGCEDASAAFATWWKFGIDSGRIIYACDRGPSVPQQVFEYLSGVGMVPASGWCVIGGTRSADGLITKGYVNGSFTGSFTQASVSAGGASAYLSIMQDGFLSATNQYQMVVAGWLSEKSASFMRGVSESLLGST